LFETATEVGVGFWKLAIVFGLSNKCRRWHYYRIQNCKQRILWQCRLKMNAGETNVGYSGSYSTWRPAYHPMFFFEFSLTYWRLRRKGVRCSCGYWAADIWETIQLLSILTVTAGQ